VTIVTPIPVNSSAKRLQVYSFFEAVAVVVDNDNFKTTNTDDQIFVFDKRNFAGVLMEIFNAGDTNSLDYEISGHTDESNTPPTITEPPEKWHVFTTGTGTLGPKEEVPHWVNENVMSILPDLVRQFQSFQKKIKLNHIIMLTVDLS